MVKNGKLMLYSDLLKLDVQIFSLNMSSNIANHHSSRKYARSLGFLQYITLNGWLSTLIGNNQAINHYKENFSSSNSTAL